jgi:hypothetical protein
MSVEKTASNEGLTLPDAGHDAYHQCWYPVAMSREVAAGKVIFKEFLDGRIVVWRGVRVPSAAGPGLAHCRQHA